MFYVYVLKSQRNGRFYVGHAEDLKVRLDKHNKGRVKSTKAGTPWEIVY